MEQTKQKELCFQFVEKLPDLFVLHIFFFELFANVEFSFERLYGLK